MGLWLRLLQILRRHSCHVLHFDGTNQNERRADYQYHSPDAPHNELQRNIALHCQKKHVSNQSQGSKAQSNDRHHH